MKIIIKSLTTNIVRENNIEKNELKDNVNNFVLSLGVKDKNFILCYKGKMISYNYLVKNFNDIDEIIIIY